MLYGFRFPSWSALHLFENYVDLFLFYLDDKGNLLLVAPFAMNQLCLNPVRKKQFAS